jgi:hypothetical protein
LKYSIIQEIYYQKGGWDGMQVELTFAPYQILFQNRHVSRGGAVVGKQRLR